MIDPEVIVEMFMSGPHRLWTKINMTEFYFFIIFLKKYNKNWMIFKILGRRRTSIFFKIRNIDPS